MTDPRDAVHEAQLRHRQLAAKLLAKSHELEAALADDEKLLAAASPDPSLAEALRARIASRRDELDGVLAGYRAALGEVDALAKALKDGERDALRAQLHVASPGDPLSSSAVDQALARVRDHAGNLEATASLGARPPAPSTETAEEKARRQLAEMKATRSRKP